MCSGEKWTLYFFDVAFSTDFIGINLLLCLDEKDLDNDEDTLCPLHQEKKAPQAIMGLSGRYRAPLANSSTPEYNLHLSFANFVHAALPCGKNMKNISNWLGSFIGHQLPTVIHQNITYNLPILYIFFRSPLWQKQLYHMDMAHL